MSNSGTCGGRRQGRALIGGEFEMTGLHVGPVERVGDLTCGLAGTWTTSGRSALALILGHLQSQGVRHVQLPSYLCESILLPIRALGLEYSFYPVDDTLTAHPDPRRGDVVLLIHYFGWINPATAALRAEAGGWFSLVEDASQALLSDWSAPTSVSRFLFLSPRKLGPVPLGGWCNLTADVGEPSAEVEALVWRSVAARLARGAYLGEPDGPTMPEIERFCLDAFAAVEALLDGEPTSTGVPQVVLEIIAGLDWSAIGAQRRANWEDLTDRLDDDLNTFMPVLPRDVVPLGKVIRVAQRDRVRAYLANQRIFCPVHWPLPAEVDPRRFPDAAELAATCITLPIDQRYGPEDMGRVASVLEEGLRICR